jgi:hypothetical protein
MSYRSPPDRLVVVHSCPFAVKATVQLSCIVPHVPLVVLSYSPTFIFDCYVQGSVIISSFDGRRRNNNVVRSTLWDQRCDPLPPLSPPQNNVERGTPPWPYFPHQKTYDWWTITPSIGLLLLPSLTPPHSSILCRHHIGIPLIHDGEHNYFPFSLFPANFYGICWYFLRRNLKWPTITLID